MIDVIAVCAFALAFMAGWKLGGLEIPIMVALSVATILASNILEIQLVKSICTPIEKLVKAADQLSQGDINQKIKIDSKDEIGALAKAFGEVSDSIWQTDV